MTDHAADPAQSRASRLNRECRCVTVDHRHLTDALGLGNVPDGLATLLTTHPHLFSDTAVFVAPAQLASMARVIAAVERVVALPGWRSRFAEEGVAPGALRPRGMFLGYDFHLGANGPQLIEINTNAGGALLSALLRRAQVACCDEVRDALGTAADSGAEEAFVAMFRNEWRLARGGQAPGTVAIVDDEPTAQFLYPEFERFRTLLAAHGIRALIADAAALRLHDDALWLDGERIDFVYNRLTDFLLAEPRHAALGEAWRRDLAVVSPDPRHWAMYADKRNLVTLTDPAALRALGADEETIAVLQGGIPRTVPVTAVDAGRFWHERKQWFFKPAAGYGSKATYRGDKLTQGKWQEILAAGDYVAQALVPPSEREIRVGDESRTLKVDIRNYVYDGRVQLVGARLYQGQTTNFRTPGGGFAAVFAVPEDGPRRPGATGQP